jgi:hypothetical protein
MQISFQHRTHLYETRFERPKWISTSVTAVLLEVKKYADLMQFDTEGECQVGQLL